MTKLKLQREEIGRLAGEINSKVALLTFRHQLDGFIRKFFQGHFHDPAASLSPTLPWMANVRYAEWTPRADQNFGLFLSKF